MIHDGEILKHNEHDDRDDAMNSGLNHEARRHQRPRARRVRECRARCVLVVNYDVLYSSFRSASLIMRMTSAAHRSQM